eukprot:2017017-Rhodomonas_salina.3
MVVFFAAERRLLTESEDAEPVGPVSAQSIWGCWAISIQCHAAAQHWSVREDKQERKEIGLGCGGSVGKVWGAGVQHAKSNKSADKQFRRCTGTAFYPFDLETLCTT